MRHGLEAASAPPQLKPGVPVALHLQRGLQGRRRCGAALTPPWRLTGGRPVEVHADVRADDNYTRWWAARTASATRSATPAPESGSAGAAPSAGTARGSDWSGWEQTGAGRSGHWTGSGSSWRAAADSSAPSAATAAARAAHPTRSLSSSWTACLPSESGPPRRNDSPVSFV